MDFAKRKSKMFEAQIFIRNLFDKENKKEWVSVRPSGGVPYRFEKEEEALQMLRSYYPTLCLEEIRAILVD
jgi:hypothetical protein